MVKTKQNNQIINVQEMLMRQMKRLDDNNIMKKDGDSEIKRSNALTNNATTYIKAINTSLRIIESANKNQQTTNSLMETLGIDEKE